MTFIPERPEVSGPGGETIVARKELQIYHSPAYADGESVFRVLTSANGSATSTGVNGSEIQLATTASAADDVKIMSHDGCRVYPGQLAEAGWSIRSPDAFLAGDSFAEWGMDDDNTGAGFGLNSSGLYVWVRSGGSKTIVASSSWNADDLSGMGPSGLSWVNDVPTRFTLEFSSTFLGLISFNVYLWNSNNELQKVTVHRWTPVSGVPDSPSPGVPLACRLDNGTSATAQLIAAQEFWFSTSGARGVLQNVRAINQFRFNLAPTTVPIPCISFRKKVGRELGKVFVAGIDIETDVGLLLYIRANATLSPVNWGNPNATGANESIVEQDITATGTNSGATKWLGLVGAGSHNLSIEALLTPRIYLFDTVPMSLYMRAIAGSATRVDTVFRIIEEW